MKIHNKELSAWHKKHKKQNRQKLLIVGLVSLVLVLMGQWITGVFLMIGFYLIHELLWSDHIFYDPKWHYQYNFNRAEKKHLVLTLSKTIHISLSNLPDNLNKKTALLALQVNSHLSGYLLDPYVLINGQAQFFERGVSGKRYLNLSHALADQRIEQNGDIVLEFKHCQNVSVSGCFYAFNNPELTDKNIMLIAPHADDAEIAAFGLYSQYPKQSFITTISAGEIEADHYQQLCQNDNFQAGQIKGLLRSWDSQAIPLWGGLSPQQSVQLGYFCLSLSEMAKHPADEIPSLWAKDYNPQLFRQFNQYSLHSDKQVKNQWSYLVADLVELIEKEKPQIIVTPHPYYDPHRDHYFSSLALVEALSQSSHQVETFFLYTNHNSHSDMFPFGKANSLQSLPPQFEPRENPGQLFSLSLKPQTQQHKLLALAMMHDLNTPLSLKKYFRKTIQHFLIGRDNCPYGGDDYLRKAVRQNEIYFVCDYKQLQTMLEDNYFGYR